LKVEVMHKQNSPEFV